MNIIIVCIYINYFKFNFYLIFYYSHKHLNIYLLYLQLTPACNNTYLSALSTVIVLTPVQLL